MQTRACKKCGKEYPATSEFFPANRESKSGILWECRLCKRAYGKTWRAANSESIKGRRRGLYAERNRLKQKERIERIREHRPIHARASALRQGLLLRSRQQGLPCDASILTVDYFMAWLRRQPYCECCRTPFNVEFKPNKRFAPDSPSLDRIVPERGYVLENVALLCWRCNNLKRDATWSELATVAEWLKQRTQEADGGRAAAD